MDDQDFQPEEDFVPDEELKPTEPAGNPEGEGPITNEAMQEHLMAGVESFMDTPDAEPVSDDTGYVDPPNEPAAEQSEIDPGYDDPFTPKEDVPLEEIAAPTPENPGGDEPESDELPGVSNAPINKQQPPQQRSQERGFSFPGLPPVGAGQSAETLADDGFFTQKMEQEGAGRDAQSDMFRAELRHHTLVNEAMIELTRQLDLLSSAYERDRL
jgi:hypothetical protein